MSKAKKLKLPNEDPMELSREESQVIYNALGYLKDQIAKVGKAASGLNVAKAASAAYLSVKEIEELRTKFIPIPDPKDADKPEAKKGKKSKKALEDDIDFGEEEDK